MTVNDLINQLLSLDPNLQVMGTCSVESGRSISGSMNCDISIDVEETLEWEDEDGEDQTIEGPFLVIHVSGEEDWCQ